jgi:hypothetical protein
VKKSVFTFGLLASSLVMLILVPFLNQQQNSFFSNVMAQGYDNYGDSYYSQYPTDDNKYQCRTGPFEGFFVSSVEFCKHVKFDDRKDHSRDNRTGTQGPPGPQGIPGIQGPPGVNGNKGAQGPPGITFLNGTNLYRVLPNLTFAEPDESSIASFAECDPGDSPVNGLSIYFPFSGGRNGTLAVTGTVSNDTGTGIFDLSALPTGYLTIAIRTEENDAVQSVVTCFDNPPLRP